MGTKLVLGVIFFGTVVGAALGTRTTLSSRNLPQIAENDDEDEEDDDDRI